MKGKFDLAYAPKPLDLPIALRASPQEPLEHVPQYTLPLAAAAQPHKSS